MSEKISEILSDVSTITDRITDSEVSRVFEILLQVVEELYAENKRLKAENEKLRDEINLLKGEQPGPKINQSKKNKDTSSEQERRARNHRKRRKSKSKKHKIKTNRFEVCKVDPDILPEDAEFKGYAPVTVQELIIKTDNVEYKREIYYSASQKKTYIGQLPPGTQGGYGPGLISFIYSQKYVSNVSEPKIKEFLENVGIFISQSTISRFLTRGLEDFHQEKEDIFQSGLCSTFFQQIDDTRTRVNGENQYVQIICNPYYTSFFTVPQKDRLSILDILVGTKERSYYFNEEAFDLLEGFRLSRKVIKKLRSQLSGKILDDNQMENVLGDLFPKPGSGKSQRIRIKEAGLIAYYHDQVDFPVIRVLLCDDARQFKCLTWELALCWIHDGRNYKKLDPVVPINKKKVDDFREKYWDYYAKLLEYKENPTQYKAEKLSKEFDQLFSTKTGYKELDDRIAKSKTKKTELLLVLKYPQLPLHNNNSELGARAEKRKQDVSLHTMSKEGTKAKDTFMTIVETAKKLGVSAYEYIFDRVSKKYEFPSLSTLIDRKIALSLLESFDSS